MPEKTAEEFPEMQWASFFAGYLMALSTMLFGWAGLAGYMWWKSASKPEHHECDVDIETMFLTPGGSLIRRLSDEPETEKPKPAFSEAEIERLIRRHFDG